MDEIYSLSFGAGVQSTALLMLTLNKDQRLFDALGGHWPDLACFADTGAEPSYVYEHLGKMVELCKEKDFRQPKAWQELNTKAAPLFRDKILTNVETAKINNKTDTKINENINQIIILLLVIQ